MLFDRFRRSSSDRAPRFAFYGKLPFDREFLRYHLDAPAAQWITSWVHAAHELMAARRQAGETEVQGELRAAIACDGGRTVLTALLRPSTDGGGRSYPSCAFCVLPAGDLQEAWHLSPLWLEPVWDSMAENILGAAPANRKEFDDVLNRAVPQPAEAAAIAARFERESRAPLEHPWQVLTAADGEEARIRAVTFVQLGRVQRDAAGSHGSIVVRIPLNPSGGPDCALQASAWLRLFSAISAFRSAWPAIIEVRQNSHPRGRSLCIFAREPTPEDLAHLLSGSGSAPIDDLRDAWDTEPEREEDRQQVERFLDKAPACLADLWRSVG